MCEKPMGTVSKTKKKKRNGFGVCFRCRLKGPEDEHRCEGLTTKGKRCGHWRSRDSNFCETHKKVKR